MQTRITTRIIIFKNNKILLTKGQRGDFWYPGGGKWEDGETLIECCHREVMEETRQKIKLFDIIYVEEFYAKDGYRNLELFFLAKPISGSNYKQYNKDKDLSKGALIKENRWFSQKEMQKVIVYPEFMRKQFWSDIKKFNKNKKIFWIKKEI